MLLEALITVNAELSGLTRPCADNVLTKSAKAGFLEISLSEIFVERLAFAYAAFESAINFKICELFVFGRFDGRREVEPSDDASLGTARSKAIVCWPSDAGWVNGLTTAPVGRIVQEPRF